VFSAGRFKSYCEGRGRDCGVGGVVVKLILLSLPIIRERKLVMGGQGTVLLFFLMLGVS
jgi:hypothetical protein